MFSERRSSHAASDRPCKDALLEATWHQHSLHECPTTSREIESICKMSTDGAATFRPVPGMHPDTAESNIEIAAAVGSSAIFCGPNSMGEDALTGSAGGQLDQRSIYFHAISNFELSNLVATSFPDESTAASATHAPMAQRVHKRLEAAKKCPEYAPTMATAELPFPRIGLAAIGCLMTSLFTLISQSPCLGSYS